MPALGIVDVAGFSLESPGTRLRFRAIPECILAQSALIISNHGY
jgi:hypothetical protein